MLTINPEGKVLVQKKGSVLQMPNLGSDSQPLFALHPDSTIHHLCQEDGSTLHVHFVWEMDEQNELQKIYSNSSWMSFYDIETGAIGRTASFDKELVGAKAYWEQIEEERADSYLVDY